MIYFLSINAVYVGYSLDYYIFLNNTYLLDKPVRFNQEILTKYMYLLVCTYLFYPVACIRIWYDIANNCAPCIIIQKVGSTTAVPVAPHRHGGATVRCCLFDGTVLD